MFLSRSGVVCWAAIAVFGIGLARSEVIRVEDHFPVEGIAAAMDSVVEALVGQMDSGDALILSEYISIHNVNLSDVPEGIQFIGGKGDQMRFSGQVKGVSFFKSRYGINTTNATLENCFFIHTDGNLNLGDVTETYWLDQSGAVKVDGTMTNSTGLWMRYNHERQATSTPSFHFKLHGSGDNVRILMMVEHNQSNLRPALVVEDGNGIAFAGGSTEGCSAHENSIFPYELINCENVYLGLRRFFAGRPYDPGPESWTGRPKISLRVSGRGNILDNIVDLGNPQYYSLLCEDKYMQAWSCCLEKPADFEVENQEHFLVSFVTNAMPPVDSDWIEPRNIDNEKVFVYVGPDGNTVDLTQDGATLPTGTMLQEPPSLPSCNIPDLPEFNYMDVAGFGRELIDSGADPTGQTASDSAFGKILAKRKVLEIPPGTYLLNDPLMVSDWAKKPRWIAGAGRDSTFIVYNGAGPVITDYKAAALKITNLTIKGGDYGFKLNKTNSFQMNVTYTDYNIAGVYKPGGNMEQCRFIGCKFVGGEYGWRLNEFSDKYLLYGCEFEGHSKGGIVCTGLTNWQGGIFNCTFKDIDGYGVALLGGGGNGYGPYCYRIDNCTFDNCGSATKPVIHNGYGWLGAVSNSTITSSKQVYAGFKGNFAILENLEFDLNLQSDTALYLGHQRYEKTAGVGMSRLVNVTTNGKIGFLSLDFMKELETQYGDTVHSGYYDGLYSDKPWAFTYLFNRVTSDNFNISYGLVKDRGGVTVELGDTSRVGVDRQKNIRARFMGDAGAPPVFYTIRGRRINKLVDPMLRNLPTGMVYIAKPKHGKAVKRVKVNR
ncbi:MAG: hypothetical protein GF344_03235 [Chitinivibrionales bacterium]|nr:hypothetical protein [Chitinivibrionales bacterium]MBD3356091.1 hypothetical protein [Chitinivibrionales bacterium]